MGQVTAKELIEQVAGLLNDSDNVLWGRDELLIYLNDAQKAIVLRRPDACTVDLDDFTCKQGTKQTLPSDALRLVDVPRNTNGRVIRGSLDKDTLDKNYPDWHSDEPELQAENFIYDARNPKTFYLFPSVVAGTQVNIVYSKTPDVISLSQMESGATIGVDDIYSNAIVEWVMFKAYIKESESTVSTNKSNMHLNAFKAQMGEKGQADAAMAPKEIKE